MPIFALAVTLPTSGTLVRTWIHDNLCYQTIRSNFGQYSQFLHFLMTKPKNIYSENKSLCSFWTSYRVSCVQPESTGISERRQLIWNKEVTTDKDKYKSTNTQTPKCRNTNKNHTRALHVYVLMCDFCNLTCKWIEFVPTWPWLKTFTCQVKSNFFLAQAPS